MTKIYLKNIINNIPLENLPAKWQGFDFALFSKDKTLFYFESKDQKSIPEIWIISSLSR
jgi:hypothetical protein